MTILKDKISSLQYFLNHIDKSFKRHKIFYWLDAGTLLKAYRDRDILGSSDFDFGTWSTDIDRIIAFSKELEKKGFIIFSQGNLNLPILEDYIRINIPKRFNLKTPHFDIYIYHKVKKLAVRRNFHKPCQHSFFSGFLFRLWFNLSFETNCRVNFFLNLKKILSSINFNIAKQIEKIYFRYASTVHFIFPIVFFQKFKKYKIYNLKLNIPTHTEPYLEYRYGKKWRTKSKSYRLCDGKMIYFHKLNFFSEIDKYRKGVRFKQKKIDFSDTRKTHSFIFSLKEIKAIKSKE